MSGSPRLDDALGVMLFPGLGNIALQPGLHEEKLENQRYSTKRIKGIVVSILNLRYLCNN